MYIYLVKCNTFTESAVSQSPSSLLQHPDGHHDRKTLDAILAEQQIVLQKLSQVCKSDIHIIQFLVLLNLGLQLFYGGPGRVEVETKVFDSRAEEKGFHLRLNSLLVLWLSVFIVLILNFVASESERKGYWQVTDVVLME